MCLKESIGMRKNTVIYVYIYICCVYIYLHISLVQYKIGANNAIFKD